MKQNIVLIGMPGAGKSTLGLLLAKSLAKSFVDTDLLLQTQMGRTLSQIIDETGMEKFLALEAELLESLEGEGTVFATGGSAILTPRGRQGIKNLGLVFYLDVPFEKITQRVGDIQSRGVVLRAGKTLKDAFHERTPLYQETADITYYCPGTVEESLNQILGDLKSTGEREFS